MSTFERGRAAGFRDVAWNYAEGRKGNPPMDRAQLRPILDRHWVDLRNLEAEAKRLKGKRKAAALRRTRLYRKALGTSEYIFNSSLPDSEAVVRIQATLLLFTTDPDYFTQNPPMLIMGNPKKGKSSGLPEPVNRIHVEYSPVNQAYLLMWNNQVLRVFNEKADAIHEFNLITAGGHYQSPPLDLDAQANALFRKLESMKGTPAEGSPEYLQVLYQLQAVTQQRMSKFRVGVPKRRGNPVPGTEIMAAAMGNPKVGKAKRAFEALRYDWLTIPEHLQHPDPIDMAFEYASKYELSGSENRELIKLVEKEFHLRGPRRSKNPCKPKGKCPPGIPAHIWNDPRFQAELKVYRRRHGNGPVRVTKVKTPKGMPRFMTAYGHVPEIKYDASSRSTKGRRVHRFGEGGGRQPWLASSVERGPGFLTMVGGTFRADGDWIYR